MSPSTFLEADAIFGPHIIQTELTLFFQGDLDALYQQTLALNQVTGFAIPVWDSDGAVLQRLELVLRMYGEDEASVTDKTLIAAEFLADIGLAQGDPEDIAVMLLRHGIDLITLMPPD